MSVQSDCCPDIDKQKEIAVIKKIMITAAAVLMSVVTIMAARVTVIVTDGAGGSPMEFAAVSLTGSDVHHGGLTDERGIYVATITSGEWTLRISAVGYSAETLKLSVGETDQAVNVSLRAIDSQIDEVVVTARESAGMTSASLIDRSAMGHLQPSSFTDLLELLPGGITKDPSMGEANIVNLRSATSPGDDYMTSALGTLFVVDGVPVNTSAEMQLSADATRAGRSSAGKGVDMRSLSTDDIESVEVVRGIASAEYGEIAGGLINIKRKRRGRVFEARFKADGQSRLFYVGKGFDIGTTGWTSDLSVDWLDSKIDPRNNRDNFKRATASARIARQWQTERYVTQFNTSLNYTGTFERDRNDPDLTVNDTKDYYVSDKHMATWNSSLTYARPKNSLNLSLTTGLSYAYEHLNQQKTIAPSRIYPMPISTVAGPNYVGFLPMLYEADYDMYGRPVTAFVKVSGRQRYSFRHVANTVKAGLEWNFSKNYGAGAVYDMMRPLTAGNTTRPRPFSDIPAMNQMSGYIENVSNMLLPGGNELEFQAGVRWTQLLNLPGEYYLSGRPYFDPRLNLKWSFPNVEIGGNPIFWSVTGGIGLHTKMPVASYLFPDVRYTDQVQLNYFHNKEQYRTMNVMTFVEDLTNYDLKAARNLKWEIRGDIQFRGNRLSLTWFREDMKDGFRASPQVHRYVYRQYNASGFDPVSADRAPVIEELPYKEVTKLATVGHVTNSSRTLKEGLEFTFNTVRIPVIRTRLTVSGAYFKTTLSNSEPLWYKPTVVLNGEELQYAGLYDDRDGSVYKSFNTNFMFDTDIPRLNLNFSLSIQNMWFTSRQTLWRDGVPTHYMDADGNIHSYTSESAHDPYLEHLIREYSSTAFEQRRVPVATTFNLKATKRMWKDRIGIALYVNRLLSITPDYYSYGVLYRRYTSPYFGMELDFKF